LVKTRTSWVIQVLAGSRDRQVGEPATTFGCRQKIHYGIGRRRCLHFR
jgi:hypothetical protein